MPENNEGRTPSLKTLEQEEPSEERAPPDGGWGWVVCFTSFWTNATLFGIINTFGILYISILKEFKSEKGDLAFKVSWIGALQISMTFFMSMFAGALTDKFGIRPTAICGAVIAAASMTASAFVQKLELLYLTYGVFTGLGFSLIYNPSMVILGHYFGKRHGLVNGFVAFGSAVSTFVLPVVLKAVLAMPGGLKIALIVEAAMVASLVLCALTWRPLFTTKKTTSHICTGENAMFNFRIWRNPGYRVWALSLQIGFLGYFVPFVHLVKHTKDIVPDANAEILVMCLGATSGVGRLVFGKVADLFPRRRILMQQMALLVMGISSCCLALSNTFVIFVIVILFMGIFDGVLVCLLMPIAVDLLGRAGAAQGFGSMLMMASFTMTAGPPLAGLIYDHMGTYKVAFLAAGVPSMLAACLMFLIPRIEKPKTPGRAVAEGLLNISVQELRFMSTDTEGEPMVGTEKQVGENETHVDKPTSQLSDDIKYISASNLNGASPVQKDNTV